MKLLKTTLEFRADTEQEAKDMMEDFRQEALTGGYSVAKCGYTYKEKKAKGEIIDSCYIVSVVEIFNEVWE